MWIFIYEFQRKEQNELRSASGKLQNYIYIYKKPFVDSVL